MGHVTYKCRKNATITTEKPKETHLVRPQVQTHPQQVYRPKVTIIDNVLLICNSFVELYALGIEAPNYTIWPHPPFPHLWTHLLQ